MLHAASMMARAVLHMQSMLACLLGPGCYNCACGGSQSFACAAADAVLQVRRRRGAKV